MLKDYTNHSGGAKGADSAWEDIGAEYGMVCNKHYYAGQKTPRGNTKVTEEDFEQGRFEAARAAARNYGYKYPSIKNSLLIRNWSQVRYSDAVFAVAKIARVGERLFPTNPKDTRVALQEAVCGGTGYAVAMAILHNKPVYVFDKQWYIFDPRIEEFVPTVSIPVLTKNFAGIGSRNITEEDLQGIRNVYEKKQQNYASNNNRT